MNRTSKNRIFVRATALAALMLAVLAAAACGAGSARQPSADAGAAKNGAGGDQTQAGAGRTEAGDFAVTTLDGEEFRLSEKRGEAVALFFMAGWCGSCIPEAQSWSKLYSAYKDKGLAILIVSVDPNDTKETIEGFRQAGKISPLPWAIDETGEVSRSLDIRALDSTVIIDREGRISYRDSAPTPHETLHNELKEVL